VADIEDAKLVVELAKWGTMIELQDATNVVFADDFDPDSADVTDRPVQTILLFGETLGTLVKHGLLDRGLVYDWLWVSGLWEKVGAAALRSREKLGVSQLYENFEALASEQQL
jgi:hypothetical protein